jgi:hypothetical protein
MHPQYVSNVPAKCLVCNDKKEQMKAEWELFSYALLKSECYYRVQEKEDEALTLSQVKVETDNCMFVVKYADETITEWKRKTIQFTTLLNY